MKNESLKHAPTPHAFNPLPTGIAETNAEEKSRIFLNTQDFTLKSICMYCSGHSGNLKFGLNVADQIQKFKNSDTARAVAYAACYLPSELSSELFEALWRKIVLLFSIDSLRCW